MLKRLLASVGILASASAAAYNYQDEKVAFELPGQWFAEQEPTAWVALRNEKKDAQFIVGIVQVKEPMPNSDAILRNIEKLAFLRREQILKLSSGGAQIGEARHSQVGNQFVYDFIAKSFAPSVRIYVRLVQRNDIIATFSLYEFGNRTDEQYLQLVRSAFSATRVK